MQYETINMFIILPEACMKRHPKMDIQEVGDIIAYVVKSAPRQRGGEKYKVFI